MSSISGHCYSTKGYCDIKKPDPPSDPPASYLSQAFQLIQKVLGQLGGSCETCKLQPNVPLKTCLALFSKGNAVPFHERLAMLVDTNPGVSRYLSPTYLSPTPCLNKRRCSPISREGMLC